LTFSSVEIAFAFVNRTSRCAASVIVARQRVGALNLRHAVRFRPLATEAAFCRASRVDDRRSARRSHASPRSKCRPLPLDSISEYAHLQTKRRATRSRRRRRRARPLRRDALREKCRVEKVVDPSDGCRASNEYSRTSSGFVFSPADASRDFARRRRPLRHAPLRVEVRLASISARF
jgi:hypothetical protein